MEKQQLIDYILNSPENTNPAILNQMIDEVGGSGGGDFSTCTGTFIQDSSSQSTFFQAPIAAISDNSLQTIIIDGGESSEEVNVLLYKGHQTVMIRAANNSLVSISGDITKIADLDQDFATYDITGDFIIHYIGYTSENY